MAFENDMDGKPLFLINGFLEAGKTQFLRFTLQQDYFRTDGRTLLITCEEGEEEYPADLLAATKTVKVSVNDISEVSRTALEALDAAYDPERIIIEWNGLWPQDEFRIPEGWFLNQIITIIDTSTLDLYLKNLELKAYLGQMLRYAELVICNRADGIPEETLSNYYLNLKAMARSADIIFEGAEGEIRGDFNIELPYDITADKLVIKPEDFGVFFIDSMDRPERYDGKEVEYTGQVMKPKGLPRNSFVPGRLCMTCCEADIQFLGPLCRYSGAGNFKDQDWVKVKGRIKAEDLPDVYGGPGPVLYAEEVVRTGPIQGVVQF